MLNSLLILLIIVAIVQSNQIDFHELNNGLIHKRVKRIIGGSDAPKTHFPYQVSLRRRATNFHFCSGSILHASVVLTAAHCVYNINSSTVEVVAGSNKLNEEGTSHFIKHAIIHEKFNRQILGRDIALLIIHPSIVFSTMAKPISLRKSTVKPNTDVIFTGWGEISVDDTSPHNDLQVILLKTISHAECKEKSRVKMGIGKGKICTLTRKGEGACIYDSGGPLVVNHQQIGILSWGEPCAKNYPDVYTKVSHFIKWINRTIVAYSKDN